MKKQAKRKYKNKEHISFQKSISIMAAVGFLVNSITASGSEITATDGFGTTVGTNGSVINITTSNVSGKNAFNSFDKFKLTPNNIANMYFGSKESNKAENLFNFVKNKVDIEGTVNAIKDNKIGGNLYFLSTDGVAIGASGVVNTGALYIVAPTKAAFDSALNSAKKGSVYTGIVPDTNGKVNIPLNPSGTITVKGKINAVDEIGMYAANITIKNEKEIGAAPTGNTAVIQTGVLDFGSLVNIEGLEGAKSGLTGDLTATQTTGKGDIILMASATEVSSGGTTTLDENKYVDVAEINKNKGKIYASVTSDGEIKAFGNVKISATASNDEYVIGKESSRSSSSIADVKAEINITGGKIEGKDVNIEALAQNFYDTPISITAGKFTASLVGVFSPINMAGGLALLSSESDINIGKDAVITAEKNLKLNSLSEVRAIVGASTAVIKLRPSGGGKVPSIATAYVETESNANITVDGKLSSGKETDIGAKSTNKIEAAVDSGTQLDDSKVGVAVLVTNGKNKSSVEIGKDAEIISQGEMSITSKAENSLYREAVNNLGNSGMATLTANIGMYESSSNIDIAGTVQTDGNLTIDSSNTTKENTLITKSQNGKSSFQNNVFWDSAETQKLMANIQGAFGTKTNSQTEGSTEDLFKVGAVAAVAIQDNNANINIKNTANISSEGDIALKALNTVEDTHMITGSKVYSTSKNSSSEYIISAGVLYADIKNNSGITVENESGANAASIVAGKNLNINSAVNMEYNRPEKLVEEFLENITALKELFSNAPSSLTNDLASDDGTEELPPLTAEDIEEIEYLYTKFKEALDGNPDLLLNGDKITIKINKSNDDTKTGSALEIAEYIAGRTEEFSKKVDKKSEDILNSTKTAAQNGDPSTDWIYDTKYLLEGIGGIIKDAADFASVGNYANFYTYSSGEGSKEGQTVTAGSASWVDLNNNSKISIGRGAVLTAGEKLTVDSKNVTEAVGIAGKLVPSLSAKSTSVGGTMNVQKFNTSSIIEAAEKAKLTGVDGIAINSESNIFHVGTTINSGTGTNALIGLVSYSGGDSDNQVSIDDETLLESEKGIEITANNDTSVTNIAGGLTYGNRAASVGLAVAINDYNVTNRAAIEDNDISRFEKSKYEKNNEVTVKASSLDVTANTTGTINSVSVAGAISKSGDDGKQGIFKKLNEKYTGLQSKINSGLEKVTGKLNSWVGSDKQKGLSSIVGVEQGGGTGGSEEQAPSLSLGAAGSSSANLLKNETTALVDGANIQLKEESTGINTEKAGEINVEAKDSAFQGAWSGAAALQWNHSGSDSSSNKSVGVEAAVGLNKINNDTNASIKNSAIENAESISVNSLSGGTQVAAGLGLDASKDSGSGGKNYQGGASASINLIDHKVTAEMVDNTVENTIQEKTIPENKTSLDVTAYESDIQVTGGVNIQTGKSSGAVGAAATVADINNTVTARIKGGTYKDVEDISVKGLLATTQVTAAMGITKSDSEASNMLLEGAVAVDLLNNTINSTIDGAKITESKNVVVLAQDTKSDLTIAEGYQAKLDGNYKKYLEEREIDYTGKGYYGDISLEDYDSEEPKNIKDTDGALIVSAAASIAGTDGVVLGAGVAVNEIANKFSAEIKNSNISAENVAADAQSATSIIGVAGGAAVSKEKFAGMGSVSWQELNNETTSKIENSKITASNVNAKAANSDYGLNIGGQISVGKSATMGAVLANSYLNNKASAYILGTSISSPNNSGVNVNAAADNNAHIITIGAGVSASKKAAINGTVAINRGGNKTEAKIDKSDTNKESEINNASSIDVTAQDNTKLKAIAGSVKAGKVAVGGDVAYSDIGGSSTESAKSSQEVLAKLNNTNITTITTYTPSSSAGINVSAIDKSNLLTIAVGVGGGENVAVEGAAATALVNKNVEASMTGANINKEKENNENADVKITAENESILMTSADVAAVGEKAGIGAGVGVNRIIQNISAILSGGTQNVKNALVKSKAKSEITTIGVGGGAAGKAGIAGSIAVNMITDNNTASVKDGAELTARGNAGVIAQSDEIISNYAGALAVGANVGLGVSTSINEISGSTLSSIEGTGTAVIAKGETKDTITTKSNIKDGSIFDECIPEDSVLMGENLSNNRVEEEKQGIVVDSSAAHTLKSLLVTAGGAVEGAGIAGTVNVNTISGDTTAKIDKAALSGGDVSITAKDYINSGGIVGSIAIAGEGVGIGASSDTNILDRTTKTSVKNSNISGNNIKIGADSKQGISSFGAAAGIAAIGGGAAVDITAANGKIDISSEETRDIDQTAVSAVIGQAAVGVNVMTNNFGTAVSDKADVKNKIAAANQLQNEKIDETTQGILAGKGVEKKSYTVEAENGGTPTQTGIKVEIENSRLTAKNIGIAAKETDNIKMTGGGASGGLVSASGAVALVDIARSNGVNISNSTIAAAEKLDISNEVTGKAELDVYQGSAGAIALGAAYGEIDANGDSSIKIAGSTLSGKNIAANSKDSSALKVNANGLTIGTIAAGAIIADAENNASNKITILNSDIKSEENLEIKSKKENTVEAVAKSGTAGLASGAGSSAKAVDSGASSVAITESGSTIKGNNSINISADNNPNVSAKAGTLAAGIVTGIGGALSKAEINSTASLTIDSGNTFTGNTINLGANIIGKGKADTTGSGGGIVGINYNEAAAVNKGEVKVNIEDETYTGVKTSKADININGKNSVTLNAETTGKLGGIFASGNNKAKTTSKGTTAVTVGNGTGKDVIVKGETITTNTAKADGSGGGIISVDGMAAQAENNVENTTTTKIEGNWNIGSSLSVNALESNTATLSVDSSKGSVVGYSGTKAINNIASKGTIVNLSGNITGDGTVSALAKNTTKVDMKALGSGYGGIVVSGAQAKNTISGIANVNISGIIDTGNKQKFEALSDGNVDIYSFVEAGGLGAATTAGTSNDMTSNNTVTLTGSLKTEKEDQDITLASSDTVKASVKAEANTQGGAAGGATAETVNEITRTNKVDVSGNIRSMDDVNLYAGKDGSGKKGRIEQEVAAEAYNSAFIPVAAPTLKNEVEQNNNINVASDKKVESVRDINLFANEGEVRMSESNIKYTWATGTDETGSYVTSSQGDTESKGFVKKNSVDIAGDLTAGIQNKQEITISGTVDFDKKSENELGTIKGADNEPTIVASEEVDKTKIKYGIIENYGEELKEQYDYLTERINEYSKLGDTKTVASLESERIRIKDQIESLGLGFVSPKTGDFVMTGSLELPYIEIPDIIASGGNIVVDTDNMKGSGKLAAQGAPQITVTNNTNLYLKVNDLIIGDLGGEIKYNGTPIGVSEDSGKLNAIINNLNKDGEGASYSGIKTFDPGKAEITVENTWGNKKVNVITEIENGEIKTSSMNVLSNIEIGGTVRNLLGIVNVINAGGDILIQGDLGSGKSGGSINAEEINLSAPKGSVSQGFTDGIVNIGSSPDAPGNWGDVSDKIIRDYITDKLDKDKPNHNVFSDNTDKSQTSGGIVAGGNIYINASDINVNGLIQSGFSEYSLELTDEDMKQINAIEENWIAAGRPEITDDLLYSYKINADGGKYNGAKYIVQAYYNPQSGEVVVEDIDPKGGQIYLTGRITSTGNGSIKALDGGANIDIINNTSKNLQVNNISNGNAQGLISITDTREDKDTEGKTVYRTITTEYRKDSTKAFEYKTNQNGEVVREEIENGLFKDSYNPDAGLRYNWLEGSKKEDGTKYEWSKKFTFWGLIHYSEKNIMDKIKDATSTKIEANTSKAPDGIYIGKVDEIRNDQQFGLVFTNGVTDNRTVIDKDETKYNNWTHFSGTQYYEWTHSYASGQTYLSSVKADKPISIDFMGNEDGEINIKSNKDVSIFGNLKNNTAEAKTTINSEGKIDQISGTDIYSNNISLTAKNGIEGIGVVSIGIKDSHDTVNLNVVTDKGNIGIDVSAGFLDGNRIEGNVNVNEISTGSGQVSLSAKGDIKQKNSGSIAIAGNRINLVSGGDIDLIVQGGTGVLSAADSMNNSINAQASKDINLTQASGDFRIGTVASEKGDVTLTVKNGNLVDALPTGEIVSNEGTDEKIQKWKDMGLLDNKSAEEIKADYEAGVKKAFEDYANLKTQKDEFLENLEKQDISSDAKAKAEDDYMNQYNGAKKNFEEKYGKSNTADEYLATNKDKDIEKIKGAQWTEDNLLYAIKESMANQTGGSTQKEVKNPNIIGHNITLNVEQGGVGVDKASETVDLMGLNKNIDALKKLASSEVADVEWKDGASTAIISHKNPIGIQMKNSESGNGKLDVTAGGNVYLAARTEGDTETNNNTIYIDKIKTNEGNIRVLGTGGIYNVTETKDNINFTGKDLIIEGGKENLGTSDKNLTTALKGTLTARADGNIYMNQVENGDMQVASIYSGKDIVLNSTAGIVSVPNELGYIRTDNGNITLTAGGSIGDSNGGQLRIKNTSSDKKEITATAKGDIYILGKADTSDGGSTEEFKLTLGDIEAGGNVDISGEAGLEVKKNITSGTGKNINLKAEKDIKIAGEDITGQNINLTAENNISLESGKLEGTNTVNLNANTGKIEQTGNNIIADSVTATAVEGINLSNAGNKFNSITASNTQNDILIKNSGDKGLNVTVEEENKGNIVVDNITGALAVLENIIASGEGSSISLTNKNGNITTSNNLTTGKDILISTETGDIISGGTITSGGMTTVKTDSQEPEKGTIKLSTVNSDGDLLVTTQNGAITGETLTSKGKADIQTGTGNISLNKITSSGDMNISTQTGTITGETLTSDGTTTVETKEEGAIDLTAINSTGNLLVSSKNGMITGETLTSKEKADIQTGTGNISLNKITSSGDMNISTQTGTITGGTLTSDGITTVKTASQKVEDGTIDLTNVNSVGDLLVSTQNGDITGNTIKSTAGDASVESTEKGDISINEELFAGNQATVRTKSGKIFIKNLTANDRISVETLKDGEIASTGLIKSVNDSLRIYSAKGDVNLNDVYANKVAMVGATDGDVIIGEINGETIILTLENSNKKLLTEKMIVGKNILTTSSQIGIDDLTQREGYDNTIVFSPRNPDLTKPMKELKMESIKLENGFLVDELWVEYAKMNLIGMKLELPKLRIVDKGYFNNSTISTTVFGADSPFDDSNVNIWNDASDNSSWIQLLFLTTGQTIYTNGVLLKGQDYYYTYDQRASGVDIMVKKLEASVQSKEKEDSFINSSADLYKPYWNTGLVNNDIWSNEGELKVKVGTGTEEMQLNKPKLYLNPTDNNITINEDEDDIIAKADTEKTK